MATNNPVLFNAALSGMFAGVSTGRATSDSVATDYAALKNACVVFATAVDVAIPVNAGLSAANATLPPTTAAIANAEASLPTLLCALCAAYFAARGITGVTATDVNPATYAVAVAAIVAQFTEASGAFDIA